MSKVLVVSLGQLRGSAITLENFKTNLLGALDADYAVCTTSDAHLDFANPFFRLAKYRWIAPHYEDFGIAFDKVAGLTGGQADWRRACAVGGNWIGGVKDSDQKGMAALLFYLRWFLVENVRAAGLDAVYSHVVLTRTDFMFLAPHPTMEQLGAEGIHLPNGEDYDGFNDRHLVVPMPLLSDACDLLDALLHDPDAIAARLQGRNPKNIETYLKLHLEAKGLLPKVKRFPYIMYLARGREDPSSWSEGQFNTALDHTIKYEQEYQQASFFAQIIRTQSDWDRYFRLAAEQDWGRGSWLDLFHYKLATADDDLRRSLTLFIVGLLMSAGPAEDAAPAGDPIRSRLQSILADALGPGSPTYLDRFHEAAGPDAPTLTPEG